MICKNCNKELAPDAKVCDACGAKLDELVEATPNKPKKSKKGLICLIAIIAVMAVVAVAFPLVKNLVQNSLMSPEEYYQKLEMTAIKDGAQTTAEYIDTIKAGSDKASASVLEIYNSKKLESTLSLSIGKSITDALTKASELDMSFLEKIGIGADFAVNDNKLALGLSLALADKDILSANATAEANGSDAYVSLPELSETALKFDLQELTGMSISDILNNEEHSWLVQEIFNALPDGKTTKELTLRYANAIISQLENVEKEKTTVNAGDLEAKATALTVTIGENDLEKIVAEVLREAKDDDTLWGIIEKLVELAEPQSLEDIYESKEYLKNSYDEIVADLDGTFADIGTIKYTLYVGAAGNIVGREIDYNESNIAFYCLTSGNDTGSWLNVTLEGIEYLEITENGTVKNSVYNADAEIEIAGQAMLDVEIKDLDTKELLSGKLTLKPKKALENMIAELTSELESNMGMSLADLGISLDKPIVKLVFDGEKKGEEIIKSSFDVELENNGEKLLAIGGETRLTDAQNLELPENSVNAADQYALISWVSGIDIMGFINTLPSGLSQLITSIIASSIN